MNHCFASQVGPYALTFHPQVEENECDRFNFLLKKNISSIEIGIKLFLECCQYDELC